MSRAVFKSVFVVFTVACLPAVARADRGEGFLSVGTVGSMSFLRNPSLTYSSRHSKMNATTFAVESAFGMGLTDWLEIGLRGRVVLPTRATDRRVSAQGFPPGDASYEFMAVQLPMTVTGRFNRGGATALALTLEAGIEWDRWSLQSLSGGSAGTLSYDIDAGDDWFTSFVLGVETTIEWRHFDHFSFRLGPRAAATTTGTLHVGVTAGVTFLWGIGVF